METRIEDVIQWSRFIENVARRYPEILEKSRWQSAFRAGELYQTVYDSARSSTDLAQLNRQLRQQRNKQMARIAIRDLIGLAPLDEVMRDVSDLADALVNGALDWHYQQFCVRYGTPVGAESGEPQKLIVIGMGKLGGQELNFSSDIDLIFVYPEQGKTEGAERSIPNDQFFVRLGQALNKSLVEYTEDGFVYRVDMRLRPFGEAGPLAVSFSGIAHYYELHGRAWERYALVKARALTGDKQQANALFSILNPFIYRRYVDFSAMQSLRELKRMIMVEVKKKGMQQNIKLGPGGIREVEFIAQAFQLVHGGRDRGLQGRQLIPTLDYLLACGHLESQEHEGLMAAYQFLRRAENRLQAWNDQQTHDLPKDESQQLVLANSMGFADYVGFMAQLNTHRTFVSKQFDALFTLDEASDETTSMAKVWLSPFETKEDLGGIDIEQSEGFLKQMHDFKAGRTMSRLGDDGVERLNALMPLLLTELIHQGYSDAALGRVLRVVENVLQRSVYLVLLKENPQALRNLIKLVEVSPWLTDMLAKYPALMDQLLDERTLYTPLELNSLNREVKRLLIDAGDDEERFMEQIRQWKHAQVFKVAAADITGHLPIMKVSDYLTWIAEAVLNGVVEFAWQLMVGRNGVPEGLDEGRNPFLVLGYGKVGGIELGYGSDLDIVLLYQGLSPSGCATDARDRQTGNAVFFVRMGQKVISLMTTLMPAGVLYEVDTRLRPNGASGMMVTDFESYKSYIENQAWNWEHQAFTRARAVVGDEQSRQAFDAFRLEFLARKRVVETVKKEVVEMRQKMADTLDKSSGELFDLKQGPGGIVDIEFMTQYLVLAFAHDYPALAEYSDNIRVLEVVKQAGLLTPEQVDALIHAYKIYRSKYHRLSLQNQDPIVEQSCYHAERQTVKVIWQQLMG